MRSRSSLLPTIGLILLVSATAFAGQLIERTVAFVNKRPILLSDVRLTKALLGLEEEPAVERSIEEALMFEEASRLLSGVPAEERVAAEIRNLEAEGGNGFSQAALRRKALAQIAISDYIDLRLRPLVRVDDAEVRRTFSDKAKDDPKAPAFDEVEDRIRESLERRSLDRRIEEWVTAIKRRADIRRPDAPTRVR
jgi:hypothetical protein